MYFDGDNDVYEEWDEDDDAEDFVRSFTSRASTEMKRLIDAVQQPQYLIQWNPPGRETQPTTKGHHMPTCPNCGWGNPPKRCPNCGQPTNQIDYELRQAEHAVAQAERVAKCAEDDLERARKARERILNRPEDNFPDGAQLYLEPNERAAYPNLAGRTYVKRDGKWYGSQCEVDWRQVLEVIESDSYTLYQVELMTEISDLG